MDQELLVESRIDDGQKLIDQLVRDGFPVRVALWIKTGEMGLWSLYIASPVVDLEKPGESYPALYSSLSKIPNSSISLSEIKLINGTNPVARAAIALRDRSGGKVPARLHHVRLGNLFAEELYIYRSPAKWFKGLDDIKRQFPSAEVFTFYVLYTDVGVDSGMQKLSPFLGRINAKEFEGRAPGTVFFLGPEATSRSPLASLVFVCRPEGWNTLYREETKKWEEVRFAATGEPPYQSVDFAPLAALKTDRKPHEEQIEQMKQMMKEGFCMTLPPDPTIIDQIPFTPMSRSDTLPPGVIDWEVIRNYLEEGGRVQMFKPSKVKA